MTYSRFEPMLVLVVCQGNISAGSSSLIDAVDGGSKSGVRPNFIRSSDESLLAIIASLSHPPFRRLNSSLDKSCMLLPTVKIDLGKKILYFQLIIMIDRVDFSQKRDPNAKKEAKQFFLWSH